MITQAEARIVIERFAGGQPPPPRLASELVVGFEELLDQWDSDLNDYVAAGGGLVRIVSAPPGGGKTHLARVLQARAASAGYLVCQVDAQAQFTDDDLALYSAFCEGLRHPNVVLQDGKENGIYSIIYFVAEHMSGIELRSAFRQSKLPISSLGDALAGLSDELRRIQASHGKTDSFTQNGIAATVSLISGQRVLGTRSLAKVRRAYGHPLLKKISRTPGKRDARLWLESFLRAIQPMGFKGVVIILDEHDSLTAKILDRHIVQLRRILDKLTEGHLPGVFAVYFVLDNFEERVSERHAALQQRILPIIDGHIPNRVMSRLEDLRGIDDDEFLQILGEKMYRLLGNGSMPEGATEICRNFAKNSISLGLTNTRQFVVQFANYLLDNVM
jgi:hypothetical protein